MADHALSVPHSRCIAPKIDATELPARSIASRERAGPSNVGRITAQVSTIASSKKWKLNVGSITLSHRPLLLTLMTVRAFSGPAPPFSMGRIRGPARREDIAKAGPKADADSRHP